MKQLANLVSLLCVVLLVGLAQAGEPDGVDFVPISAAPEDFDGDGILDEDDRDEDLCDDCTNGTKNDGDDEDYDWPCHEGDPYADLDKDC